MTDDVNADSVRVKKYHIDKKNFQLWDAQMGATI